MPEVAVRRLALAGAVSTFALIVLGGVVRVSDSGLGCGPAGSGLEGWPLCGGALLPGLDAGALIEYAHRALASVVGLLMLALAFVAWRRLRARRDLVRASVGAAVLVIVQGLLGAATVELNLDALLVAAHLGLGMLLLGLLVYLWWAAGARPAAGPAAGASAPLRLLATVAALTALLAIVAGGYMAGTEHNGRPDEAATTGAHYACGTQFPGCNGEFLPFGQAPLVDVHLTHRLLVYVTAALVLVLVALVLRRRSSPGARALALAALGVLAAQVLVGALNVWVAPTRGWLVVLHLGLGTLLWSGLIGLRLSLSPLPAPAPSPDPAPRRREVVAA
jgi:heme A synthase